MAPRRRPPTTPHQLIRIVIVEPRALVGVGIHEILDREPDMEVVAEVRSADDAIALAEEGAPDVFILDVELREPMTSAATHRLAQEAPDSGMVVVGGDDNDASILDAIEIGAMGHLAAAAEPEELVAVVRKVAEGEDPLRDEVIARPDLVDKILEAFREGFRRVEDPAGPPLSARELEVLREVARGQANREIGETLDVTEQTVKNHLTNILQKLGVHSRTVAVTVAVREGWIALEDLAGAVEGPSPARPRG